jgi:hypothetical protein
MKRVVLAIAGLLSMTALAAHAQGPTQGLRRAPAPPAGAPAPAAPAPAASAPPAAPAAPARACFVVTQANGAYAETPLAGFDPAVTSAPLPAVTVAGALMVVCNRTTIIPEVTDYRVLTELRLPLAIRTGAATVLLGASGGKLQIGLPDGQVSPGDTKALEDRLAEMQTVMARPAAKK